MLAEKSGRAIDAKCHSLTASWVRQRAAAHPGEEIPSCRFFENMEDFGGGSEGMAIPSGVYTMEDMKDYGRSNGVCPYFLARLMLAKANIVIYSYHYLLDPKVADLVSRDLPKDAIIVFDEAHNIDNVCIESLSVDLNRWALDAAARSVQKLADRIQEIKSRDADRLREEYNRLVEGLQRTSENRISDHIMSNPIIPDDLLQEAVPGNIRQGEHFVAFLRRFVEHLKVKLRTPHVVTESPASFLQSVREATTIERKPLRFCAERLTSLVKTLELANLEELSALQRVANFATLVATYQKGFLVILEPFDDQAPSIPNPILHLCCLDATIAIKPVFSRFQSVIITSGTLSPLDMYPKILNFSPVLMQSFPMTLARNIVCPLIVTRGADQVAMTSRFEIRNDPAVVRNYGSLLLDFCRVTPDGLVCFFPSYIYLEMIVTMWHEMGVLNDVLRHKLLFIETPDSVETSIALENYRRVPFSLACILNA